MRTRRFRQIRWLKQKKCCRHGCGSGYDAAICYPERRTTMEEHVIVAARIAAMAGQDDALSGIAAYTEDGALSAIGLTPAMGTDLVIQILRTAYEAALPAAQPVVSESELECMACHRIYLRGSPASPRG